MDGMAEKILAKVSAGLLPLEEPKKTWGSYGNGGSICAACEAPIVPTEVEHELDFEATTLRFHAGCDAVWREVRLGLGRKSADTPLSA